MKQIIISNFIHSDLSGDGSVSCVTVEELSPPDSSSAFLLQFIRVDIMSPRLQTFSQKQSHSHIQSHTPYGRMSDSCRPRCIADGDCVAENGDDGFLYVCTRVCVGATCQRARYSVRVSLSDRSWAVVSVNQTKSSTCIFIMLIFPEASNDLATFTAQMRWWTKA